MTLFKRSNGFYYYEYFDIAVRKKKRVSTKTKNKKDALKFVLNYKPKTSSNSQKKYITLHTFRDEYCSFVESNFSKKHSINVRLAFKFLVEFIEKDIPLIQINIRIFDQFFTMTFQRTKHGASLYKRALNAAFNKAVDWEYVETNPVKKIKLPKIEKNNLLFISEEEFNIIRSQEKNEILKDLYTMAFYTGMRLGEIINLKWSSVNLQERIINVTNTESFSTKSRKERIIPIYSKLNDILNKRFTKVIKLNAYVFERLPGIQFTSNYVSLHFKKCVVASKMSDKYYFHVLRKSFGSELLKRGASMASIQKLLGHESISTTENSYAFLNSETLKETVKLFDKDNHPKLQAVI